MEHVIGRTVLLQCSSLRSFFKKSCKEFSEKLGNWESFWTYNSLERKLFDKIWSNYVWIRYLEAFVLQIRCWACNFIKKRFQYRCFSVKFAKFLRASFYKTPTVVTFGYRHSAIFFFLENDLFLCYLCSLWDGFSCRWCIICSFGFNYLEAIKRFFLKKKLFLNFKVIKKYNL